MDIVVAGHLCDTFSYCSCDADPTALSKYVVALLRKEKPKAALKELCIDQLEVFLAKGY